jgi:hypothetical protein
METNNAEENWLAIKQEILEVARESLGYKTVKKKTWIRAWNEELKQILDRKNMNVRYIYKLKTHNNTLNIRNSEQSRN